MEMNVGSDRSSSPGEWKEQKKGGLALGFEPLHWSVQFHSLSLNMFEGVCFKTLYWLNPPKGYPLPLMHQCGTGLTLTRFPACSVNWLNINCCVRGCCDWSDDFRSNFCMCVHRAGLIGAKFTPSSLVCTHILFSHVLGPHPALLGSIATDFS